jgi:hypothetical protein
MNQFHVLLLCLIRSISLAIIVSFAVTYNSKMMKHLILMTFILMVPLSLPACIINQLDGSTNYGISWPTEGPTWGQSFVACESGEVMEIAFWPHAVTTGMYSLELNAADCSNTWIVTNILVDGGNPVIVDLSTGSGTSRNVVAGTTYIFHLVGPPTATNLQLYLSETNPYPGGEDIADNCASYGLDLWFRVGIGESLTVLPVEMLSFEAALHVDGTSIELEFSTASESGASHFEIEHSVNGLNYQEIGEVKASGNAVNISYYNFEHRFPGAGINYYRLKQVDEDGNFKYSKVISILFNSGSSNFSIAPNPANHELTIYFNAIATDNGTLNLYNIEGQLLKHLPVEDGAKKVVWAIDDIPSGIYLVSFIKDGIPQTLKKVVKQ